MYIPTRQKVGLRVLFSFLAFFGLVLGGAFGVGLAATYNTTDLNDFNAEIAALPTEVYDINGELITEFYQSEKRELVSLQELPDHLVQALLTREDQQFYEHNGISLFHLIRAAWFTITNQYRSGGSTLTMQLAKHLYSNVNETSIARKLNDIWYALQLERAWTKEEILEEYMNKMPFGAGTSGVEAAAQFYFDKSAREVTIPESVMIVIQLASINRGLYNPLRNPNSALEMQRNILGQMDRLGYIQEGDVDQLQADFIASFDWTKPDMSAFFNRDDQAPYFSEYIRSLLQEEILLGDADIYEDGFKVYTTLNLEHQRAAERRLAAAIETANDNFERNLRTRIDTANHTIRPVVDALALAFNLPTISTGSGSVSYNSREAYIEKIHPIADALSLLLGSDPTGLRDLSRRVTVEEDERSESTTVEGALITIENTTGYITAMVGGSQWSFTNQTNRAIQGRLQPGSTFKPLYYSAAIEDGIVTPASMFYDSPFVFTNPDGSPYRPLNYKGTWSGLVSVRHALSTSMNVPSLRVLDAVGFDRAIEWTSNLLQVPDDQLDDFGFSRSFSIGLGTVSANPLMMARAFASFPNEGKRVTPLAIRYIEDRHGRIIANPEQDLREQQVAMGDEIQVMTPQTAYVMTDMLMETVETGTLRGSQWYWDIDMPMAGKTGTTQNWTDAWTVGFSPYVTTAVWLGFDQKRYSLGINQTGATAAGPLWARYMGDIHEELPRKEFVRPAQGLVTLEVAANSGLLIPAGFRGDTVEEIFIAGTEPRTFDNWEQRLYEAMEDTESKLFVLASDEPAALGGSAINLDLSEEEFSFSLDLDPELFPDYTGETDDSSSGNPFLDPPSFAPPSQNETPDFLGDFFASPSSSTTVEGSDQGGFQEPATVGDPYLDNPNLD